MRRTLASLLCTLGLAAPPARGADHGRLEHAPRAAAAGPRWTELVDDRAPATAVDAIRMRLPTPSSIAVAADGTIRTSSAPFLEPPREVLLDPRALDRLAQSAAAPAQEQRGAATPTATIAAEQPRRGAVSATPADGEREGVSLGANDAVAAADVVDGDREAVATHPTEANEPAERRGVADAGTSSRDGAGLDATQVLARAAASEGGAGEEGREEAADSGEVFAEPEALATLPLEEGCTPIEVETLVEAPTASEDSPGRVRTPEEEAADARRKAWAAQLGAPLERSWEHRDVPRLHRFLPAPAAQAPSPSQRSAELGAESAPVKTVPPSRTSKADSSRGWSAPSQRSEDRRVESAPVNADSPSVAADAGRMVLSGAVPQEAAPRILAPAATSQRRMKSAPPQVGGESEKASLAPPPAAPPLAPAASGEGSHPKFRAAPPSVPQRATDPAGAPSIQSGADLESAPIEGSPSTKSAPVPAAAPTPAPAERPTMEADLAAVPIAAPAPASADPLPNDAPTSTAAAHEIMESDLASVPMDGPAAAGGGATPQGSGDGGSDAERADWEALRRWQSSGAAARAAALARMKPRSSPTAASRGEQKVEAARPTAAPRPAPPDAPGEAAPQVPTAEVDAVRPAPSEVLRDAPPQSPADGPEAAVAPLAAEAKTAPSTPVLSRERLRSRVTIGPAVKTPVVVRVAPPPSVPLTRDLLRSRGQDDSRPSSRL